MSIETNVTISNSMFDKIWKRDNYLAKINPAQIHRRRMIKYFLKQLKLNPKKVLDIGCGTGELLFELGKFYPQTELLGCDLSIESGKLMESIVPYSKFCSIDVEKDSDTPFGGQIDLITCSEVLEHCKNPNNVVRNAYAWLNKDGVFFITVPSGNMTAYDKAIGHLHHYTTSEIESILSSCGFINVRSIYWGAPFHTLYRKLVGIASKEMEKKNEEPNKHILPVWIVCKIFNLLFYFNFIQNSGCQIFAWGYKQNGA